MTGSGMKAMEKLVLPLFCALLLVCVSLDLSLLYALGAGLLLFLWYGRTKGFSWRELRDMALSGVLKIKTMLLTFLLIGVLTGLWRAAGTVPTLVVYASSLIRPSVFLLMAFLLNCGLSVLTGTSFGTAATMGVICAAMGRALGLDIRWVGGAVLSGVFFGDRCSPVSTSALLVSTLTGTDIYANIRRMVRSALIPFLLSCAVYALAGWTVSAGGQAMDLESLFQRELILHWTALIPAAVILLLALLRVNVKIAMAASIVSAVPLCLLLQGMSLNELFTAALTGFTAQDAEVGAMLNGGGVTSMLRVMGIVCLSSSYAGIFEKTGLLDGIKGKISALAKKATPFAAACVTAIVGAAVSCNQTLTILLTHQLCGGLEKADGDTALDLEDSAVVLSPLIPWCIAGAVPLSVIGAPLAALPFACYLYLLPLCHLAASWRKKRRNP